MEYEWWVGLGGGCTTGAYERLAHLCISAVSYSVTYPRQKSSPPTNQADPASTLSENNVITRIELITQSSLPLHILAHSIEVNKYPSDYIIYRSVLIPKKEKKMKNKNNKEENLM